jgi:hypothetical protein
MCVASNAQTSYKSVQPTNQPTNQPTKVATSFCPACDRIAGLFKL